MRRPLTAENYQDPNDIARKAAEGADSSIETSIDDSFDNLRDAIDVGLIAAALAAGGWLAVRQKFSLETITEAFRPTTTALVNLQNQVGAAVTLREVAAPARPPLLGSGAAATPLGPEPVIQLTYDPIASATVADQQVVMSGWLKRISDTIEAVIDQDIRQGLTNGMTAMDIAQVIKQTIGLTPKQAAAVENYRQLLLRGDQRALDRKLRDARFDRSVTSGNLDPDKIDKMVARYSERFQAYRAKTIARTESLRATNAGRRAAWQQYADRKGLGDDDVLRYWQTAHDERVCPICSVIPLMNLSGVALDDFYDTPVGPVRMPPEPHPNCRCTERYALASEAGRFGNETV